MYRLLNTVVLFLNLFLCYSFVMAADINSNDDADNSQTHDQVEANIVSCIKARIRKKSLMFYYQNLSNEWPLLPLLESTDSGFFFLKTLNFNRESNTKVAENKTVNRTHIAWILHSNPRPRRLLRA